MISVELVLLSDIIVNLQFCLNLLLFLGLLVYNTELNQASLDQT